MPMGPFVALLLVALAQAPASRPAPASPCLNPDPNAESRRLRLLPVDEAVTQPDFFSFRARLQAAIARRDEAAVLATADPGIRTSFGSSSGLEAFRAQLRDSKGTVWADLASAVALGGAFRSPDAFEAPYVFAKWPDVDSFACTAVIGDLVRVRVSAEPDSAVVTRVSFDVVQVVAQQSSPGAVRVRLWNGRTGFVSADYVRSPVAHRAIFQRVRGAWRLAAFVAGD
jgi:hypothetical protein